MKKIYTLVLTSISFLSISQTFTCGDTLLDIRDGKKYTTVLIGTQCWMKQNLNYGKTVNSYSSAVTHSDMFNNSIAEKYAPNGDSTKLPQYGGLYEWDELMNYSTVAGGQGLCPANWHVPTDAEWQTMISTTGGTMVTADNGYGGNRLKNVGEGFGAGAGTNTSGFSAKAGGDRDAFGIFYGLTLRFIFWTSTQSSAGSAHQYTLWAEKDTIAHDANLQKVTGLSCRCVRNAGAGIKENDFKRKVFVYPNPSKEKFTVGVSENGNSNITVVNILGEEIYTENFIRNLVIETKEWKPGVYFYNISNGIEKSTGKLIIQ